MTDVERAPCPSCGEPAALVARVCPHCRGSALVDLFPTAPMADARRRYALARAIVAMGLPGASMARVQAALADPTRPLVAGLTRAAAREATAALGEQGLAVREDATGHVQAPASPPATRGHRGGRLAAVLAGAALVVATAALFERRSRPAAPAPAAALPAAPLPTARPRPAEPATALTTHEIAERATPAMVSLRCKQSLGSGFFVADGLVLTNSHVACEGERILQAVFPDGHQLAAETVKRDPWLDLALVRILGAKAPPLPIGDATRLGAGDKVVMIGSPRGLDFTVHEGTVSHVGRNVYGLAYVQVDANVNPGNSGGPLLDREGRVVGVVSMMVGRGSGLGLALPINYAFSEAGFITPPAGVVPERWSAFRAQAEAEDQREIAALAEEFDQDPTLVSAYSTERGDIVAVVARRTSGPPEPVPAAFNLVRGSVRMCGGTFKIARWQTAASLEIGDEDRYLQWLFKRGLARDLYVGFAALTGMRSACGAAFGEPGVELHLFNPRHESNVSIDWSDGDS